MSSQVRIQIKCPQCGAGIDFLEETKVIHCDYCGNSLLVAGRKGIHRYVLQPRHPDREWAEKRALQHLRANGRQSSRAVETFLFFAPFWRMQGVIYSWIFGKKEQKVDSLTPIIKERKKEFRIRILDHTIPAYEGLDLGLSSLGVRAQVMHLQEFNKDHHNKRASFLPVETPLKKARKEAERLSEVYFGVDNFIPELIHHRLVDKKFSVIYFPIWCVECQHLGGRETLLLDALGGGSIKDSTEGSSILIKLMGEQTRKPYRFKEIQFLPFRCPNCGWELPFRPLSVLHFCNTCLRLWQEKRGSWSEVSYQPVAPPSEHPNDGLLWVPFWGYRLTLESSEGRLDNMADLYGIAPPPRALDHTREAERPIQFFVPAVPLRDPKQTHNLASRLTFLQPELQKGSFPNGSQPMTTGASMGDTDARQLWSSILGAMLPHNPRLADVWLNARPIKLHDPQIFYFPFEKTHLLWKGPWTGVAFQRNALAEKLAESV